MPYGPVFLKEKSNFLSFEEIKRAVEIFSHFGLKKIRFTGGEPFLRKDFHLLLRMVSEVEGIEKIGITTNGFFIDEFIEEISKIGKISSINVSLDTLKDERFKKITGVDGFQRVVDNITLLNKNKIPVKVNVVLIKGVNDDEIESFVFWGAEKKIEIRFIELMSFRPRGKLGNYEEWLGIRGEEIIDVLSRKFTLVKIKDTGKGEEFLIKETGSKFGIIFSNSSKGCSACSKLRLTPEGKLLLCLKSTVSIDLRKLLSEEETYIYDNLSSVLELKRHISRKRNIPSFGMNLIGG